MTKNSDSRIAKKVLLVGWDAADWKVINPLVDAGRMPNIQKMMERGVMGNIATLHPVLSPMLWTSIATGKRPYKHGIYGFYEPTPDGSRVQPITNLSRKTKAVWNILNQNGLKSNVVGWWPSHPAEPIDGVMVSDMFHKNSITHGISAELQSGTVHPAELSEELAELRMDIREVGLQEMQPFIPTAADVDQDQDNRLAVCAKIFAEATSIQTAATHVLETTEWDFSAVYFDAIDHFSHGFMKYNPPRREFVNEADYDTYKNVVQMAYVYHDMMLGRLMELAGDEAVVILMSDHGFHPDHLRPKFVPMEPAGPAIEHRDLGVFAMHGPGVKSDQLVFGTTLLDITPTILTLFGLPVGKDMDGRVLTESLVDPPSIDPVNSWDEVSGNDGCHPPTKKLDAQEIEQALKQLVDLGYIEDLSGDNNQIVGRCIRELNYNLARSYMDAARFGDALPLLRDLYQENSEEYRIGVQLAMCYKAMNRIDDLEFLLDSLSERRLQTARQAHKKLGEFKKLERQRIEASQAQVPGSNAGAPSEIESAAQHEINPQSPKDPAHPSQVGQFSKSEWKQIAELRSRATVTPYYLDFLRGYLLVARGDHVQAVEHLERAIQASPDRPALHIQIGEAFLKLKRYQRADDAFERAYQLDDQNPHVLLGRAKCLLGQRKNADAAKMALQSIAKTFHYPMAHYTLGLALVRLGRFDKAVNAFENAIQQNPNFPQAYRRLAFLHKNQLKDVKQAEQYFDLALQTQRMNDEQRKRRDVLELPEIDENESIPVSERLHDYVPSLKGAPRRAVQNTANMSPETSIVVVSGLPRSGTSLMMQMLKAGGVQPMTDGDREADQDNPKGYLELVKTKNLARNNAWVTDARGMAVKVIAPLLEHLPAEYDYKVIFMDRSLDEIVRSQSTMLSRNNKNGGTSDSRSLQSVFGHQMDAAARLIREKGIATLRVPYRSAVNQPKETARRVKEFLSLDLDIARMVHCVDPELYRNRSDVDSSR